MNLVEKDKITNLFGRKTLTTDIEVVTSENVLEILREVSSDFEKNQKECEFLYQYYKGQQTILSRTKDIRPEINNKIVVNRASEIADFKSNYLLNEPIQYVSKNSRDDDVKQISTFLTLNKKISLDKITAHWNHICGTTYRIVLDVKDEETPFRVYHLDPRQAFVVYHNGIEHKPVLGGNVVTKKNGVRVYTVYTDTQVFVVEDDKISKQSDHPLGYVPIIEYPLNEMRMGCFEDVISILDAINNLESNRIDDIEQTVQSILTLTGFSLDDDTYEKLKDQVRGGLLVIPNAEGKAQFLLNVLDQSGVQTFADHLYETIITIKGIPNRNGANSTSDTGLAVYFRDGHSQKETNARDTEVYFRESEQEMLKIVLRIVKYTKGIKLSLSDIEIKFTRHDYENINSKIDNMIKLSNLVEKGMLDDKSPFTQSGVFTDPETAYSNMVDYRKKIGLKDGQFSMEKENQNGNEPIENQG